MVSAFKQGLSHGTIFACEEIAAGGATTLAYPGRSIFDDAASFQPVEQIAVNLVAIFSNTAIGQKLAQDGCGKLAFV